MRGLQDFLSLHVVAAAVQGMSTRPERIPATLAGLQELNGKILQDLQQQLQTHLTQAQKALRAQVCHDASLLIDTFLSKCRVLGQILKNLARTDPLLPFADGEGAACNAQHASGCRHVCCTMFFWL